MSKWHNSSIKDISFSDDGKEIHIWYKTDNDGNCYISVKTEDMKSKIIIQELLNNLK